MSKISQGVDMTEKALTWLRSLPRVSLNNLRNEPGGIKHKRGRGRYGGKTHGAPTKKSEQRQNFPSLGFEGGSTPFYLKFKNEPYYAGHHLKRQYPHVSLLALQKLIDTDRLDTGGLVDVWTICRTGLFSLSPEERHFGFQLTDEGINKFEAKIDLEIQYAPEHVIAAIEKLGGSVTLAYYDVHSLTVLQNPKQFFERGEPIPKRMLPPEDAIEMYTDPKRRGYLADPQAIEYERGVLAQKYGYELVKREPPIKKDPLQIFFGLQPGWVVNLKDKAEVLLVLPKDQKFQSSEGLFTNELSPEFGHLDHLNHFFAHLIGFGS